MIPAGLVDDVGKLRVYRRESVDSRANGLGDSAVGRVSLYF